LAAEAQSGGARGQLARKGGGGREREDRGGAELWEFSICCKNIALPRTPGLFYGFTGDENDHPGLARVSKVDTRSAVTNSTWRSRGSDSSRSMTRRMSLTAVTAGRTLSPFDFLAEKESHGLAAMALLDGRLGGGRGTGRLTGRSKWDCGGKRRATFPPVIPLFLRFRHFKVLKLGIMLDKRSASNTLTAEFSEIFKAT
jgi:hypothetical protein